MMSSMELLLEDVGDRGPVGVPASLVPWSTIGAVLFVVGGQTRSLPDTRPHIAECGVDPCLEN